MFSELGGQGRGKLLLLGATKKISPLGKWPIAIYNMIIESGCETCGGPLAVT